jgi:chemotaxis regulatin CheY-phosphate phosphatase CheZ
MPVVKLSKEIDLTPKTSLNISGNGKVIIEVSASIDVPEPLLAQQIVDAVDYVATKASKKIQDKVSAGEKEGWDDEDLDKFIGSYLVKLEKKINRAVNDTINDLIEMGEAYAIIKKQDIATAVSTSTSLAVNITKLVVTGGTDVTSWASLAKTLHDAATYLEKVYAKIEDVSEKSIKSVKASEKYYRTKVFTNKESSWDKFCKFFSDPLSNAKGSCGDLRKKLVRSEKPCHDMSKVIQKILTDQDAGDSSPDLEKKLDKLLQSVTGTMTKATLAKDVMRKLDKKIGKIEADLKKLKGKKGGALDKYLDKKTQEKIAKDCKDLKKYSEDNALAEWGAAANATINLAKEVAKLF